MEFLEWNKVNLSTRMFSQLAMPFSKKGAFDKVESLLFWLWRSELVVDAQFFNILVQTYMNADCGYD